MQAVPGALPGRGLKKEGSGYKEGPFRGMGLRKGETYLIRPKVFQVVSQSLIMVLPTLSSQLVLKAS